MAVGHVWVDFAGEGACASLSWASGKTAPKRDLVGRPAEQKLIGSDGGRNEQTRLANFCSMCGIVVIDLELKWERCPKCRHLIQPLKRACVCGWSVMPPDDRSPKDFTNCEDAIAAAARLDQLGEWDAAIAFYENIAQRWPEQRDYFAACVKGIKEKQALD